MTKDYSLPTPGQPIPDRFTLGRVCIYGHKWHSTGLGLRYSKGTHSCVICQRNKSKKTYAEKKAENPTLFLASVAATRSAERALYGRESNSKYGLPYGFLKANGFSRRNAAYVASLFRDGWNENQIREQLEFNKRLQTIRQAPTVAELVWREQLNYWRCDPIGKEERRNASNKKRQLRWRLRYSSNPDLRLYHRQKSKRRKAAMRNSVAIQLTGAQVRARFQQFKNSCAYCGCSGKLHIEHVVPISKGGTHALGNIVPACQSCNFSKAANQVEAWYRQQSFFCKHRWGRICRAIGWDRASVGQLALL